MGLSSCDGIIAMAQGSAPLSHRTPLSIPTGHKLWGAGLEGGAEGAGLWEGAGWQAWPGGPGLSCANAADKEQAGQCHCFGHRNILRFAVDDPKMSR